MNNIKFMWVVKFKAKHNDCAIVNRCEKFKVSTYAFPAGATGGVVKKRKYFILSTVHILEGKEKDCINFIEDLKKDKSILNLENKEKRISYQIKIKNEEEQVYIHMPNEILFLKPVFNHHDGYEYWEVGSWNKQEITKFIKTLEKHMDFFLVLKFKKTKILEVYFPVVFPILTEKQKKALQLAKNFGYYEYPKRTDLKELAKIMKVSVPTFQEHLKKAEMKLIPMYVE